MDNKITNTLLLKINKAEGISPCLFLGENLELINADVLQLAQEILQAKNIPLSYLYKLDDNGEKIKIGEIKNFIEPSNSLPGYEIQIFLIENISRFTIQSGNSCLKFFEEPGKHNVIFLTNNSESGILDTILSRVQIFQLGGSTQKNENPFFQSLIKEIVSGDNSQALNYFYKAKLEKDEYIEFLNNLIFYSKKHFVFIDKLNDIQNDIQGIQQNNVNAKYVVDKYLLTL